jgi:tight adherence protein C
VFDDRELVSMLAFLGVFLGTGGVAALLLFRHNADRRRARARLRDLGEPVAPEAGRPGVGRLARSALPRAGALLAPAKGEARARLHARLTQAGLYSPQALPVYLGVKMVLMVALPVLAALLPHLCGLLSLQRALLASALASGVGLVAPGLWLDHRKKRRQSTFRRALPDALDMIVLCVEGGVSLTAGLQRVTGELQTAHPLLAAELNIVQREMQLGQSAGEALRSFGQRCDLEEVRNLASVLLQSERFGAGVVKALRIHADTSRMERQQRAEEMAQKAAVKILFPTLLCIFPAIFIVILGPAAFQIATMFARMK